MAFPLIEQLKPSGVSSVSVGKDEHLEAWDRQNKRAKLQHGCVLLSFILLNETKTSCRLYRSLRGDNLLSSN